jgi:hypothetical protein
MQKKQRLLSKLTPLVSAMSTSCNYQNQVSSCFSLTFAI